MVLANLGRVLTVRQLLSGLRTTLPGIGKPDVGIDAQGEGLFLTLEVVFKAPPF